MGLYRIQLKQGAEEKIPAKMISMGLPIIRIEPRENKTHYFYEDPKSKRESSFWTHAEHGQVFCYCGLSSSGKAIAKEFAASGLFANKDNQTT
jgi:hypothetical protein